MMLSAAAGLGRRDPCGGASQDAAVVYQPCTRAQSWELDRARALAGDGKPPVRFNDDDHDDDAILRGAAPARLATRTRPCQPFPPSLPPSLPPRPVEPSGRQRRTATLRLHADARHLLARAAQRPGTRQSGIGYPRPGLISISHELHLHASRASHPHWADAYGATGPAVVGQR
ncbi:hypothetical protein PMIN01_09544 [Paraphaeosphaeria minitans]|uniref:Uncharacterized protein n=1 Tax=Paraphaeosphaeria minitans TaxID=565426 RepID=A0A9P6KNF2_9PLEO|nr:hypothetical protein PMIN01_09544 [Paraphaeosphaeria minitans]